MVEFQTSQLDTLFHALGDGTRRKMLATLADGERSVGQLAEPFSMSLAAASKHIKALEQAGLCHRVRQQGLVVPAAVHLKMASGTVQAHAIVTALLADLRRAGLKA